MSHQELQAEEREVLESIYDGDASFKKVNDTAFQYKFGEDGDYKAFLVEIIWGDTYPDEKPSINMNAFFNKHVISEIRENILTKLDEQAEQQLGSAMTYTLFEWTKENAIDLMIDQPDAATLATLLAKTDISESKEERESEKSIAKKDKKIQLTKAQKRKMAERTNPTGEYPRGWDWVDVVKHLSQGPSHHQTPSDAS